MNRDRRSSSQDPTSEPAARQSTSSASGLSTERDGPGVERSRQYEETVNRTHATDTPRRYDQPLTDDEDPVMPADDSTMNTKM